MGHTISVTKIQPCHVPQKQPQTICINGHNCVSIKFYLQKLAAGPQAAFGQSLFYSAAEYPKEAKKCSKHLQIYDAKFKALKQMQNFVLFGRGPHLEPSVTLAFNYKCNKLGYLVS